MLPVLRLNITDAYTRMIAYKRGRSSRNAINDCGNRRLRDIYERVRIYPVMCH
jgi:hypothetical protein